MVFAFPFFVFFVLLWKNNSASLRGLSPTDHAAVCGDLRGTALGRPFETQSGPLPSASKAAEGEQLPVGC